MKSTHRTGLQPKQPAAPAERDYRKEVWLAVATAVARAENASDRNAPGRWADEALKAFDATFPGGRK